MTSSNIQLIKFRKPTRILYHLISVKRGEVCKVQLCVKVATHNVIAEDYLLVATCLQVSLEDAIGIWRKLFAKTSTFSSR